MKLPTLLFLTTMLALLSSCSKNVSKTYQKGNDEKVIQQVLKKEIKRKASTEEIKLLEEAFKNLQAEKLNLVQQHQQKDSEQRWEDIFNSLDELEQLQNKIKRNGSITSKKGYTANLNFVDVQKEKRDAGQKAAKYYIDEADFLYKIAMKNPDDYLAARDAYNIYEKIERFDSTVDVQDKKQTMLDYGTIIIGTRVETRRNRRNGYSSNRNYSYSIERKLEQVIDFSDEKWIKQKDYFSPRDVDFIITIGLVNTDIDYVNRKEDTNNYNKEIEVKQKDSNGNITTVKQTVSGSITKISETKEAEVVVELRIEKADSYINSYSRLFYGYDEDQDSICSSTGDERALPKSANCSSSSFNFDSDETMLENAIRDVRYDVRREVEQFINSKK